MQEGEKKAQREWSSDGVGREAKMPRWESEREKELPYEVLMLLCQRVKECPQGSRSMTGMI